ncbi:thioesterase domain-containing protein [Nonomuraea rhizosphaerae]|uniref:thioesterase domain-containing protein n=1 Tax=Nonomuraea rhizosphaerae TaxID=2665663 RepID=UPI001C5F2A03|nr:thioesterase domain-containing protein [Nonomuraea rhizosphaerae]
MRDRHVLPEPQFASLGHHPPGAPLLFCLPYAGGDVTAFWVWRQAFDGLLDVRVVMLPGREGRMAEPGALSPELIARSIAGAVAGRHRTPYSIYGHSMGARIAFEVVRELRRLGVRGPKCLYVGAAHPPERQETLGRWTGLSDEDLVEELIHRLGAPAELRTQPEVKAMLIPALRTDMEWLRAYRFTRQEPLDVPIVAFAGAHDREVAHPVMLGWARHTSSAFRLHTLDAAHLFLATHGDQVARTIAAGPEQAGPEHAGPEHAGPGRRLPPDEVHVWLADLGELPELCAAADELSPREAARAARFRQEEHRRWFTGRSVLLRRLLREHGAEPGIGDPRARPGGGPHSGTGLACGLGHSGGLVLVALTAGQEVGTGIGRLRPLADERAFFEGALDEREREEFAALPEELRLHSALRTWTAKEAVLKAAGDGPRVDQGLFGFAGQRAGATWVPEVAPGAAPEVARLAEWRVTHLPLGRAIAAIAVRAPRYLLRFETVRQGRLVRQGVEAAG